MQLVVGQDEVPQVHQALEVGVVQAGEAVGVQVESVEVLEVSEGIRPDLTDGVSAQRQVDLEIKGHMSTKLLDSLCHCGSLSVKKLPLKFPTSLS